MLIRSFILIILCVLFLSAVSSCNTPQQPSQIKPSPKFKIGEKVCVMESFNGMVTYYDEAATFPFGVEYITQAGTKYGRYRDFQLSSGKCEKPIKTIYNE